MTCSNCSSIPNVILYACSGAADVGELADRATRVLSREGSGRMSCAVGMGSGVQSLRNAAVSAGRILAIDGCATRCVAKALAESGVTEYVHLELVAEGFPKGGSPATEENLGKVCGLARRRLEAA